MIKQMAIGAASLESKFVCGSCDVETIINGKNITLMIVKVLETHTTLYYPCKQCGVLNALWTWGHQPVCSCGDGAN